MMGAMTFAQKLDKLCEGRRWTQADLVRAVNAVSEEEVSTNTVSRWFNGVGKPFNKWAVPLARALEVPLDYLADDAQNAPPRPELDPDERSILVIFRGLHDNQGMTKKEARDRLMAMSVEAMERLNRPTRAPGSPAAPPSTRRRTRKRSGGGARREAQASIRVLRWTGPIRRVDQPSPSGAENASLTITMIRRPVADVKRNLHRRGNRASTGVLGSAASSCLGTSGIPRLWCSG
jgi:transcriptional regulator with XRE-family HTH domain